MNKSVQCGYAFSATIKSHNRGGVAWTIGIDWDRDGSYTDETAILSAESRH